MISWLIVSYVNNILIINNMKSKVISCSSFTLISIYNLWLITWNYNTWYQFLILLCYGLELHILSSKVKKGRKGSIFTNKGMSNTGKFIIHNVYELYTERKGSFVYLYFLWLLQPPFLSHLFSHLDVQFVTLYFRFLLCSKWSLLIC